MGIIGEKLTAALNNINQYVWKGKKVKTETGFTQEEVRLVDSSEEELRRFYQYCNTMINNTDKNNLGRAKVLKLIEEQRAKCNAELCLRNLESKEEYGIQRHNLNTLIHSFLEANPEKQIKDLTIGDISNIDQEFKDIPLIHIIDGCIDKLGVFNRQYLTLSFILKQGIWLTNAEMQDLTERGPDGEIRNRIDVIRDRLSINSNINFKINSRGLTFSQLRAMLQLKNKKYSEMSTEQLKTLRGRILFDLEDEVKYHISQWNERIRQIKEVAESKGIEL